MRWSYVIAVLAAAASSPGALGDDVATARHVMRAALLEQAPVPSRAPRLPSRDTPSALTREHLAKAEAERAAHRRAERDASAKADALHAEMANRAAIAPMMRGCSATGTADSCAGSMPADMMKSRGQMAGGGMMPDGGMPMPGHGMPGGGGMPSGGMTGADTATGATTAIGGSPSSGGSAGGASPLSQPGGGARR